MVLIAHIAGMRGGTGDVGSDLFGHGPIEVGDHHRCSFSTETLGDDFADTFPDSGHKSHLVVELSTHVLVLRFVWGESVEWQQCQTAAVNRQSGHADTAKRGLRRGRRTYRGHQGREVWRPSRGSARGSQRHRD